MIRATYEGKEIAKSDKTIFLEGNHYFPKAAVEKSFLKESDHHTTCPWKGLAYYYHIQGDELSENAAWYYPEPKDAAKEITDYIAFDTRYVNVEEVK
jgi:uncharacterized protein (DUF427 family)